MQIDYSLYRTIDNISSLVTSVWNIDLMNNVKKEVSNLLLSELFTCGCEVTVCFLCRSWSETMKPCYLWCLRRQTRNPHFTVHMATSSTKTMTRGSPPCWLTGLCTTWPTTQHSASRKSFCFSHTLGLFLFIGPRNICKTQASRKWMAVQNVTLQCHYTVV